MIEKKLLKYLTECLEVPVAAEWQQGTKPPCVILEKTDGTETDFLRTDRITIHSYGRTLEEAAELNGETVKAVGTLPQRDGEVAACRKNAETNYSDAVTKRYRYQTVYEISYFDEEEEV